MKAAKILPDARLKARELEGKADELKVVAEDLKGAARLEDLTLWQMEKTKSTKKGSQSYFYPSFRTNGLISKHFHDKLIGKIY